VKRWGAVGAAALTALTVSPLVKTPGRLLAACAKWIGVAAGLELLSMLGFVLVFALVFGASSARRPGLGTGLRALGAITVLPAGGVVGPGLAARTASPDAGSVRSLARSTVALTILTNAPEVLVLGLLSVSLWLGWPDGPHDALRTLPAAGVAAAVLATVTLAGRRHAPSPRAARRSGPRHVRAGLAVLGDGAAEARALVGVASVLGPHRGPRTTPAGRVVRSGCAAGGRRALSSRSRRRESRPTSLRHRMSRWRRQPEGPR
jgi:hypothetical protein